MFYGDAFAQTSRQKRLYKLGGKLGGIVLMGAIASCRTAAAPIPGSSEAQAISEARCGAEFVYVPRGRFLAGSTPEEVDYAYRISAEAVARGDTTVEAAEVNLREGRWFDREPEQRSERLPDFCMSKTPVTNAQYQEFVLAIGYHAPGITPENYQEQNLRVHSYDDTKPYTWRSYIYPADKADHPVVLVSQEDAVAYALWKSREDGAEYRLPTALEWEKAARGTDGRYFAWGNAWADDRTNWQRSGETGTSPVGTYPDDSVYGATDMAGNVFEFTADTFTRDQQVRTIMKGCAWDDLPGFCRAAYQHSRPVNYKHILFGFRLVKPAESLN
ncbi:MAG: SUMF1/EgtB/PvdO family nonheme iron enzyme [Cyanobacteria bacterium P01_A01_bin.105]